MNDHHRELTIEECRRYGLPSRSPVPEYEPLAWFPFEPTQEAGLRQFQEQLRLVFAILGDDAEVAA